MTPEQAHRRQTYLLGYRHGRRLAEHRPLENHEPGLRLELHLTGDTSPHRAFALGELRGYREGTRDD